MKFIGIKSLITILVITSTMCASLRREETETEFEATMKNLNQATVTASGGNWENGFNCPSIMLSQGEGKEVNQGAAHIQGIKMMEWKGQNVNGLVLNFEKPIAPNSFMSQISKKIAGNQIYIPWRFVENNYIFDNPYFNNKNISGDIKNDAGASFHMKINFPYALLTTYVEDDKGNKIRARVNQLSTYFQSRINETKEFINMKYPEYARAKKDAEQLAKGAALIDGKVKILTAEQDDIKKNNGLAVRALVGMRITYNKEYVASQAANAQIAKIDNQISETNAMIKAMSDSISNLGKSKSEPQVQISAAKKEAAEGAKKADAEYNVLLKNTPGRTAEINASRAAWTQSRIVYRQKLNSFVPK